ncbi:MAG: hypothetical protein ACLQLC_10185 [Candidatus Sulfotelmatobacter sp.]
MFGARPVGDVDAPQGESGHRVQDANHVAGGIDGRSGSTGWQSSKTN